MGRSLTAVTPADTRCRYCTEEVVHAHVHVYSNYTLLNV